MKTEIGARIKKIRTVLKLNQVQFAAPLGVHRSHIASIETGARNPSEPLIRLIRFIYCVNEDWLRSGQGEMFTMPEEFLETRCNNCGFYGQTSGFTGDSGISGVRESGYSAISGFLENQTKKKAPDCNAAPDCNVLINLPQPLHYILAEKARKKNMNLNQYIVYQLARGTGCFFK